MARKKWFKEISTQYISSDRDGTTQPRFPRKAIFSGWHHFRGESRRGVDLQRADRHSKITETHPPRQDQDVWYGGRTKEKGSRRDPSGRHPAKHVQGRLQRCPVQTQRLWTPVPRRRRAEPSKPVEGLPQGAVLSHGHGRGHRQLPPNIAQPRSPMRENCVPAAQRVCHEQRKVLGVTSQQAPLDRAHQWFETARRGTRNRPQLLWAGAGRPAETIRLAEI